MNNDRSISDSSQSNHRKRSRSRDHKKKKHEQKSVKHHKKQRKHNKHKSRARIDKSRSSSLQKQRNTNKFGDSNEYKHNHKNEYKHNQKYKHDRRSKQEQEYAKKQHKPKTKYQQKSDNYIKHQLKQQHQPYRLQQQQQQIEKQLPSFEPSGILLQYYNARQGVSLKFNEPPQAKQPNTGVQQWRIYPFKNEQPQQPILLVNSSYLVGKDERICDILCDNESVSRQHAVIQFRASNVVEMNGNYVESVKPYIMDLESTNGTLLNNEKIQASRYYQLLDKDTLKFGLSTREYVFFRVPNSVEQ